MSWYLAMPLMTPVLTAVAAYLLRGSGIGRWVAVAGSALGLVFALMLMNQVIAAGVVTGQMSDWPAPFGITLIADLFSGIMVLLTAGVGLAVAVYACGEIDDDLEEMGFFAIFQLLLAGVTGAFLTGDLFNLYVWFEVLLISSFGLLILGGTRQQIDGAVKYVVLNLVSTIIFLCGLGLLYGATGTLNMADLRLAVDNSDQQGLVTVLSMFFLVAFAMKAAVFPLFFWLPASYHTPTSAVSAIFAGLLSKVGVYALFRTFTLIFDNDPAYTQPILYVAAALTMVTGILGALAQTDMRRVMSYQIVSSIGFLILGLAIGTPLALAGAIFYLVHNIIVKVNLFLVAGVATRLCGSSEMSRMGGVYKTAPLVALLFLVPAFTLAGFPPLTGFWAKVLLVQAALEAGNWGMVALVLIVSLLTIWSLMIVWARVFWAAHPEGLEPRTADLAPVRLHLLLPIAALGLASILIGLFPNGLIVLVQAAAAQLLDPQAYVDAVLGGAP
ncbi:Na+/H+ antiporter subunit D [Meridianimarinicoccus sp. RP-17]|uniref:Na+/H+ antiporter subunit D n=1 Tax=Meridianimarinicoccus zhengii TaxID=2056810 RepID=UPI000DADF2E3|nr:Na+/H+ antiporter subunit D [Phycocomes zhengii]